MHDRLENYFFNSITWDDCDVILPSGKVLTDGASVPLRTAMEVAEEAMENDHNLRWVRIMPVFANVCIMLRRIETPSEPYFLTIVPKPRERSMR